MVFQEKQKTCQITCSTSWWGLWVRSAKADGAHSVGIINVTFWHHLHSHSLVLNTALMREQHPELLHKTSVLTATLTKIKTLLGFRKTARLHDGEQTSSSASEL